MTCTKINPSNKISFTHDLDLNVSLLYAFTYRWAFQVLLMVKNSSAKAGDIRGLGSIPSQEDSLEEGMATHSNILDWKISRREESGGL